MSNREYFNCPIIEPSYIKVYNFERFDLPYTRKWVSDRWYYSIYASIAYVIIIFGIKSYMRNRRPFDLSNFLFIWNLSLSLFSLIAFTRVFPELFYLLRTNGVLNTICTREGHNIATAFWGMAFVVSKFFEFGDTLFIVLRKKELMFLHWYHHLTVFNYSWLYYNAYEPPLRIFGVVNYFIHFLMYGYYALKAKRIKISKKISKLITILQMSQMVIGIFVNLTALWVKLNGEVCVSGYDSIALILIMYASYLVLFAKYFVQNYVHKRKSSQPQNDYNDNQKKLT